VLPFTVRCLAPMRPLRLGNGSRKHKKQAATSRSSSAQGKWATGCVCCCAPSSGGVPPGQRARQTTSDIHGTLKENPKTSQAAPGPGHGRRAQLDGLGTRNASRAFIGAVHRTMKSTLSQADCCQHARSEVTAGQSAACTRHANSRGATILLSGPAASSLLPQTRAIPRSAQP